MSDELERGSVKDKVAAIYLEAASGNVDAAIDALRKLQAEKNIYPPGQTPPISVAGQLIYYAKDMDRAMAFIIASQGIPFHEGVPEEKKRGKTNDQLPYHVMKELIERGRTSDAEQFARGLGANNVFTPGKSGDEIMAKLRKDWKIAAERNRQLLQNFPRQIGGTTETLFRKSLSEVYVYLRVCKESGRLDEARRILGNTPVVLPDRPSKSFSAEAGVSFVFEAAGLPEKAEQYAKQARDAGVMMDVGYDLLAEMARTDGGKAIFEYLGRYKTEAERGYKATIIMRSVLKGDESNFGIAEKLWPFAIGWCMQRDVDADIGKPVTGFFHDEYRPNTYPACLIQLLPNYSFVYSLRGH